MLKETGEDKYSLMRVMALMVCVTICYAIVVTVHSGRPLEDIEGTVGFALGALFLGKAGQKGIELYNKIK